MTKNQFLTDANEYLAAITPNYAPSTIAEKSRKLRMYARIMYRLHQEGKISCNSPSRLKADDIHAYVTYRRSTDISDSTLTKDISMIGQLLAWKGNNAIDVYRAQYGNRKPRSYNGKLDPLENSIIDRVYDLARSTNDWLILEGCMTIVLGAACGLRPQESRQLYADDVHLMGNRSTIHVKHVKGEGTWGRERDVPIMDDAEDIVEKYLRMRSVRLKQMRITSRAMFPTFRSGSEFVTQQSFGRYKSVVEDTLGVEFELRDARRAFGQRLLDQGYKIEQVSSAMGHSNIATTLKYYANYRAKNMLDGLFERKNGACV